MAHKRVHHRRSWRPFRRSRHRRSHKVPIEMLIAGGTIPFIPPYPSNPGYTLMSNIQAGRFDHAANCLMQGFLGYDLFNPSSFNFFSAINPFDMSHGVYTKILIYAGLIGMVRKKLVKRSSDMVSKIPLIGRWVN